MTQLYGRRTEMSTISNKERRSPWIIIQTKGEVCCSGTHGSKSAAFKGIEALWKYNILWEGPRCVMAGTTQQDARPTNNPATGTSSSVQIVSLGNQAFFSSLVPPNTKHNIGHHRKMQIEMRLHLWPKTTCLFVRSTRKGFVQAK